MLSSIKTGIENTNYHKFFNLDYYLHQVKQSLEHLPENKQQEILEIADIIKEAAKPEMIILFGSYAKGTYVEHRYTSNDGTVYEYISDYDFLVVTEKNTIKEYELEDIVNSRTKRTRPDINIQLHEVDYVNEGLAFGQYFFTDIIKEGVLLYDTKKTNFTEAKELTNDEQKEIAQRYFDMWYESANGFLETAKYDLDTGLYKIGAFVLHQATENFYNTVLLVYTGYKPKTHSLYKLRKHAKQLSEKLFFVFPIETNKEEHKLFDLLKRGYIDARYKSDYYISKEELSLLIQKVEEIKSITETICIEKINSTELTF